jgi:peptide/nickel transport system ATP-binding protein
MGTVMITHDLGVVAEVCTRVVVMYLGQVIEEADVESLFASPFHPYTQGLLKSIPQLSGDRSEKLHVIEGKVPTLHQVPKGCRFAPRCEFASQKCLEQMPELLEEENGRKVRCWHYKDIIKAGGDRYVHTGS